MEINIQITSESLIWGGFGLLVLTNWASMFIKSITSKFLDYCYDGLRKDLNNFLDRRK
jgi:hypothetical protein